MWSHRIKELLVIVMIGEGVLATFYPRQHLMLWHGGPRQLQYWMANLVRRPGLVRSLSLLELGLGLWLARRQFAALPFRNE